jgi:hypothetical protein
MLASLPSQQVESDLPALGNPIRFSLKSSRSSGSDHHTGFSRKEGQLQKRRHAREPALRVGGCTISEAQARLHAMDLVRDPIVDIDDELVQRIIL